MWRQALCDNEVSSKGKPVSPDVYGKEFLHCVNVETLCIACSSYVKFGYMKLCL